MASKHKYDRPDVAKSKFKPQTNPELVKGLELAGQLQFMCLDRATAVLQRCYRPVYIDPRL